MAGTTIWEGGLLLDGSPRSDSVTSMRFCKYGVMPHSSWASICS